MLTDYQKDMLKSLAGFVPHYEVRPISVVQTDVKVGPIEFQAYDLAGSNTALLTEQELNRYREHGLLERLKPQTILDIGANVGIWALYASKVHPHARVICVEPVRELFEVLTMNTKPQSRPSPTMVSTGIATAHAGIAPEGQSHVSLGWSPHNPGGASFQYANVLDNIAKAPACTIERLLDILHLDQIDFVKMDIEGMEYAVLADIKNWKRIKAISVEMHNNFWLPDWANEPVVAAAERFLKQIHEEHGTVIEVRRPTADSYILG